MKEKSWDDIYKEHPLEEIPGHSSQPDRNLFRLIKEGKIKRDRVLKLCSYCSSLQFYWKGTTSIQ